MANINVWSKVAVAVQTALGAPKTITAITKANPAVASSTAHGMTNGLVGLFKVNGMRQLDYRVVRVAGVTTDSFQLEGVDSTAFDTFISGTFEVITFGASASSFKDVTASGGEAAGIDTTTIHDDQQTEIPGNRSPLVYSFGSFWIPSDPALLALNGFDEIKSPCAVQITFATGNKVFMVGYPSAPMNPTGSSGASVDTPITLRLRGRLTFYEI